MEIEKNNIKNGSNETAAPAYPWEHSSDEELLKMRVCDLALHIEGTELQDDIREFYSELDAKGLIFHPVVYLADEWLTPDGEPVIGVPFFLAHPRLKKLEQKFCMDVEGGTRDSFKRLLRHEAGHAFNYAYLLHKKERWNELFGPFSKEYRDRYTYRPYSKSYVLHLEDWYAQCHPDEDFAETFAVWLTPNHDWKNEYKGWKALEKLEYTDTLMKEIQGKQAIVKKGNKCFSASRMKTTLEGYYKRKRRINREDYPDFHDSDLERIFTRESSATAKKASQFIRIYRVKIINDVSLWTGGKKFIISRLLQDLIERSNEIHLFVSHNEMETILKLTAYVTSLIMNYRVTGSFGRKR
ncbi:MAG: hypothetical protein JW774_08585 [Candidatus Aureabacteria bacterium]|nr:hypothetical protein [Candidatus Auribacterota bacterium]